MIKEVLLEVIDLKKYFVLKKSKFNMLNKRIVKAVDGVSFNVFKGETLGFIGDSGSGKTTTAWTIMKLYEPSSGKIYFDGEDITDLSEKEMLTYRKRMQMIFQDPYSSLDPRIKIGTSMREPLRVFNKGTVSSQKKKVKSLMKLVELKLDKYNCYPHQLSGGERQRVCIVRALVLNPDLVICDEAIASLDASIQAQIVNLLRKIQNEFKLSYLFISHDLNMISYISNHIAVMYLGQIVEFAPKKDLIENPLHPYTRALISSIPEVNPEVSLLSHRIILKGEIPSPVNPPSGCYFHTRCPDATELCKNKKPELREVISGHYVACNKIFYRNRRKENVCNEME